MAIGVMTWVWNHSRSRNGARLVLLAIADAASDDGTNAWPSIATIMRKANIKSDRTVQAAIKELERLGELRVQWNAGPGGANRYTVVMKAPANIAPPQNLPPADSAGTETGTESDTNPQGPPQNLPPAESAPPQNLPHPPANSADEPSLNRPSSSSSKKTRNTPRATGTPTGTTIPDDFGITPAMAAWHRSKYPGLSDALAEEITEEFADYWRTVVGAKAIKADWDATWKNWLRRKAREATQPGHQRPGTPAPPGSPAPRQSAADRVIAEGIERAERMRALDAAEAAGQLVPSLFQLPPGRTE